MNEGTERNAGADVAEAGEQADAERRLEQVQLLEVLEGEKEQGAEAGLGLRRVHHGLIPLQVRLALTPTAKLQRFSPP